MRNNASGLTARGHTNVTRLPKQSLSLTRAGLGELAAYSCSHVTLPPFGAELLARGAGSLCDAVVHIGGNERYGPETTDVADFTAAGRTDGCMTRLQTNYSRHLGSIPLPCLWLAVVLAGRSWSRDVPIVTSSGSAVGVCAPVED